MLIMCKETVKDCFEEEILFTEGNFYGFNSVDNQYTRRNGFIGYILKDDTKHKRWLTKEYSL